MVKVGVGVPEETWISFVVSPRLPQGHRALTKPGTFVLIFPAAADCYTHAFTVRCPQGTCCPHAPRTRRPVGRGESQRGRGEERRRKRRGRWRIRTHRGLPAAGHRGQGGIAGSWAVRSTGQPCPQETISPELFLFFFAGAMGI